eukprot:4163400-Amphidinium_carterae.1
MDLDLVYVKVKNAKRLLNYKRSSVSNAQDLLRRVKQDQSQLLTSVDVDSMQLHTQEDAPQEAS